MRFQRIIEQVYFRPWFITAEGHAAVSQLVQSKLGQSHGVRSEVAEDFADYFVQRRPLSMSESGVATIDILGVLGQGLAPIEKACGNTDYAEIRADIATASSAKAFVFRFSSPGGMCSGCVETARLIAAIRVPKIAYTDSLMCSAAYALAAGCDAIYATDSAIVGSIGTICPWVDSSEAVKRAGLEFRAVTSNGADLKSAGHLPTLTEAQIAGLQELVNDFGAQFVGHVKAHRDPNPEVFRAGAYAGTRALAYGLVDGLMSEAEACATLSSAPQ